MEQQRGERNRREVEGGRERERGREEGQKRDKWLRIERHLITRVKG